MAMLLLFLCPLGSIAFQNSFPPVLIVPVRASPCLVPCERFLTLNSFFVHGFGDLCFMCV